MPKSQQASIKELLSAAALAMNLKSVPTMIGGEGTISLNNIPGLTAAATDPLSGNYAEILHKILILWYMGYNALPHSERVEGFYISLQQSTSLGQEFDQFILQFPVEGNFYNRSKVMKDTLVEVSPINTTTPNLNREGSEKSATIAEMLTEAGKRAKIPAPILEGREGSVTIKNIPNLDADSTDPEAGNYANILYKLLLIWNIGHNGLLPSDRIKSLSIIHKSSPRGHDRRCDEFFILFSVNRQPLSALDFKAMKQI
ncbi:hypothetical protein VB834_15885 [Limnoraphis robusta Tam1]|uniref:hypothetical protein n=1 Tax=Limnoraphis robusta TaxID=1118279 RepID=UPI002B1F9FF5|nr:hypothetical protein [Limnoraphis robusta]MEA5540507.1 hypothetical protein [Limnoraphis robusta Tam1]